MKEKIWFGTVGLVVITMIILIGVGIGKCFYCDSTETLYPLSGIVIHIVAEKELVIFEDYRGYEWTFYGTDWEEGDACNCIMKTNLTKDIFDDEVVKVEKERWE